MNRKTLFPYLLQTITVYLFLIICGSGRLSAGVRIPDWLKEARRYDVSAYREDHDAVVLYDHIQENFTSTGRDVKKVRYAVMIFSRNEVDRASVNIPFNTKKDKITHFKAWILNDKHKDYAFKKSDMITVSDGLDDLSLYSEMSYLSLDVSSSIFSNSIFAYEYTLSEKTIFYQTGHRCQDEIPLIKYILEIEVPRGWVAKAYPLNNPAVTFEQNKNKYIWKGSEIPAQKGERAGPPASRLFGGLGINVYPEDETKLTRQTRFRNWNDVAAFSMEIEDDPAIPDETVKKKALEIIRDDDTLWDKLKSLGKYAQSVNYVSISEDLYKGGGIKPFPAHEVLKRHYGDCKDKTALMRAFLTSIGVESYAVSAKSGRDNWVHENWPATGQFNHCIIAIKVDETIQNEAVIEQEQLGRLLIFDPTDDTTPIGQLPESIQDSLILIDQASVQGLDKLPISKPEQNSLVREIALALHSDGCVDGKIDATYRGTAGSSARNQNVNSSRKDYDKGILEWLSNHAPEVTVEEIETEDHFDSNQFKRSMQFTTGQYARSMRGRILSFKPVIISRIRFTSDDREDGPRTTPCHFFPYQLDETITVTLPEGFIMDEISEPVNFTESFASYRTEYTVEEKILKFRRVYRIEKAVVPPEDYDRIVTFYTNIMRTEQSPVVLVRNP